MTGSAGSNDWNKPVEPPRLLMWVADHRRLVRALVGGIAGALIIFLALESVDGLLLWWSHLQIVVWVGLTWQAGWNIPRIVDRWRASER